MKVNPADVVSIPTDYNNTKARVCQYEVIGELTHEEAGLDTHSFNTSVYVQDNGDVDVVTSGTIAITVADAVELLNDTLVEVAVQKEATTQVSDWFVQGYHRGFVVGQRKEGYLPEATLADDQSGRMTQTDIDDLNAGFRLGYPDGKGHKARKHARPSVVWDPGKNW